MDETTLAFFSLQVGAAVLSAFPPRGIIHLLDRQHTFGTRPAVERLVAEEYILDTMTYFEADRVECAKRLAKGERESPAINMY